MCGREHGCLAQGATRAVPDTTPGRTVPCIAPAGTHLEYACLPGSMRPPRRDSDSPVLRMRSVVGPATMLQQSCLPGCEAVIVQLGSGYIYPHVLYMCIHLYHANCFT